MSEKMANRHPPVPSYQGLVASFFYKRGGGGEEVKLEGRISCKISAGLASIREEIVNFFCAAFYKWAGSECLPVN